MIRRLTRHVEARYPRAIDEGRSPSETIDLLDEVVILVGDDGSPGAEAAQTWAAQYASAAPDARVVRAHVSQGSTSAGLLSRADEEAADLIVLGRRGSGGFSALELGSTAHQVAERSPIPVAVVPHEGFAPARPLSRLAVGVDGTPHSGAAAEWTARVAAAASVPVWAVHALDLAPALAFGSVDGADYQRTRRRVAEEVEQRWCAPLRSAGVDHQAVLAEGGAGAVLLEVVKAHDIDLLVVGRGPGWPGALMGSVAHRAIAYSPCVTVVVPSSGGVTTTSASQPRTDPPDEVDDDDAIDAAGLDSFPASDPPGWWAGPR